MDQALAEAARCLLCHEAPCSTGCPASTEPDRFIRKLRLRNIKGAVAVIKENNILGGICAAVCPTGTLCQQGCVASGMDEPIRIGELQRWLVEYGWDIGFNPLKVKAKNGIKVAIVGGGPSGLTCATELAREGFEAVVFEKRDRPGGMLWHAIPNHRLSREFVEREIADVTQLGVEIRCNSAIDSRADLERLFADGFQAVYLATGAAQSVVLDVPGREAKGVYDAIFFLGAGKEQPDRLAEQVGGKEVIVVGGGDTAMDAARTAVRLGAKDVFVVYRRSFAEMPGSDEEKQATIAAGVHFIILTQPVGFVVENGIVRGVKVVRNRLGEPDDSGRRRPIAIEGSKHTIMADIIVEAIGLKPEQGVRSLGVNVDGQGRIVVVDGAGRTSTEGVFAGGDAVRGASIVANAVRDGKFAARAVIEKLGTRG